MKHGGLIQQGAAHGFPLDVKQFVAQLFFEVQAGVKFLQAVERVVCGLPRVGRRLDTVVPFPEEQAELLAGAAGRLDALRRRLTTPIC